ncbi:MAG: tRNA (adenosine(37)-N6)-threonylcarbamoyltransferase complex ATPase subunit type 1 TsaE [Sedimentisphaerales bacterium]|nr:tRNA (adenosine(37)-N6)-threonylcarbamoyltransferase complex ATPase subunit type 1 TsaE [Sedimentisphaerales bacterium]
MSDIQIISKSVEQTIDLGFKIGQRLKGGEIVALIGTLGTGKTHLIKGLGLGLEILQPDLITSPTFTLINEYEGRLLLYHIDAYRLENEKQLEMLGFDEICAGAAVVVVEWADLVWPLVNAYHPMIIHLEHFGECERNIRIEHMPDYIQINLNT